MHLVRFRRWVRLMILGQATIETLETPNPSDARKREIKSTKKHETHPAVTFSTRETRLETSAWTATDHLVLNPTSRRIHVWR